MKKTISMLALSCLLAACGSDQDTAPDEGMGDAAQSAEQPTGQSSDIDMAEVSQIYSADLMSTDGVSVGTVMVSIGDGGNVSLALTDMAAGTYAMHFHETGKCDAPDFKTAGGHWNPTGKDHGRENPQGAHAGDLPNLVVEADGGVKQVIELPDNSASNMSKLLDDDGAAFIVHAEADDMTTDPSGNAGARIVCGVLTASASNI